LLFLLIEVNDLYLFKFGTSYLDDTDIKKKFTQNAPEKTVYRITNTYFITNK